MDQLTIVRRLSSSSHRARLIATVSAVTLVAIAAWLLGVGQSAKPTTSPPSPVSTVAVPGDALNSTIAAAQATLKAKPRDFRTWAVLGLAYVQQAKATADPSYYAKAEGAVVRSLQLDSTENDQGFAAKAALRAAEHRFTEARDAALAGIRVNAYNSTLYGALADAYTQLGQYERATAAVDKMNELEPGVPAFTRASYVLELRGDIDGATAAMQRAVEAATNPSDLAFTQYYLGELAFNYGGDARAALSHYQTGLAAVPTDFLLSAGRARALAALGHTAAAVADYKRVVGIVPQLQFVLEFGELQESVGDPDAARQYELFRTVERVLVAGGVSLDVESTLFEADHGIPIEALRKAQAGWKARPFLEMADAYAWALHVNGRNREALDWSNKALSTGWPNALSLYHRGIIHEALGQRASAKADLGRSLRLNPHFSVLQAPRARQALKRLSSQG